MTAEGLTAVQRRFHMPRMAYEEKVFNLIFLVVLLVGLTVAEYLQHVRVRRDVFIPGPEIRKVAEVQIREPREPAPKPVVTPPKPEPPRKLTEDEKKKRTAPPPSSAVGSPRQAPQKPEDLQKMVARKGLLGMLSTSEGDRSPRAYQPSKKRDVSEELKAALQDLSGPRPEDDDNDFLGVGNLPDVARRGTDIGYILNAAKIGEIRETQVEFYGGVESLPEEIQEALESGTAGRTASDIRKIVASYLGGLRYLYNKELRKDPELKGKLVVRFEISPSGRVTQTDMVNSTLGAPSLEEAILSSIQKWKFPRIPEESGSVKVTYPFVFLPPAS